MRRGGELVKLKSLGGTGRPVIKAGPFGSSITKDTYTGIGYKVYGQEQVVAGDASVGDYYISSELFQRLKTCEVQPGDLLISVMGTVGKVLVIPDDHEPGVINPRLLRVALDKAKVCPYYMKYFLESEEIGRTLTRWSQGGTMGGLNAEIVGNLKVFVPDNLEQKRIVELLSTWDRAIDLTERLIVEKHLRRKGLMQQLLTGKRRLPGFTGRWREVRLGNIFHNRIEVARIDLPLVSIAGDRGVIPRDEIDRKDSSNEDKSKYLRICPGDIGYNTMRMWQGVSGLSAIEGIVSPAYTILTPKQGIDAEFMAILFKFQPVVHLFYRHSQGMVSDTWNLKFRHFAKIEVTIPNEDEQKAIAKIFRSLDRELDLLQAKAEALREQKKGLMQQLLTGKKRVKI
jgi:type I restriction enzyme S subunit